jgi:hypothetical protein
MSRKDKIVITRTEDFSEIESELSCAMDRLDETNVRIEALLQEHAKPETGDIPNSDSGAAPGEQTQPEPAP